MIVVAVVGDELELVDIKPKRGYKFDKRTSTPNLIQVDLSNKNSEEEHSEEEDSEEDHHEDEDKGSRCELVAELANGQLSTSAE